MDCLLKFFQKLAGVFQNDKDLKPKQEPACPEKGQHRKIGTILVVASTPDHSLRPIIRVSKDKENRGQRAASPQKKISWGLQLGEQGEYKKQTSHPVPQRQSSGKKRAKRLLKRKSAKE